MYKVKDLETQISNKNDCLNFYSKFYYRCHDKKNIILVDADKKLFKLNNNEKKLPGYSLNNNAAILKHPRFKDLKLEFVLPYNNAEHNLEIVNSIKDSLIKRKKSNTLNVLSPVKGGFLAQYKNINGFLPKNQLMEMLKDFMKENTKSDKPLSNNLYFLNLHKKNKTFKPKFSFDISNITITPYFSKKNFASSPSQHIFEGSLNFVFIYKKQ